MHPASQATQPRGIIEVNRCLSIKGAEDAINKAHAFEISTTDQNMYFIADSDKVGGTGRTQGLGGRTRLCVCVFV